MAHRYHPNDHRESQLSIISDKNVSVFFKQMFLFSFIINDHHHLIIIFFNLTDLTNGISYLLYTQ